MEVDTTVYRVVGTEVTISPSAATLIVCRRTISILKDGKAIVGRDLFAFMLCAAQLVHLYLIHSDLEKSGTQENTLDKIARAESTLERVDSSGIVSRSLT